MSCQADRCVNGENILLLNKLGCAINDVHEKTDDVL